MPDGVLLWVGHGHVLCHLAAMVRGRHHATMTTDSRHLSEGNRTFFPCALCKNCFIRLQCEILCVDILTKRLSKQSDRQQILPVDCEMKIKDLYCWQFAMWLGLVFSYGFPSFNVQ